MRPPALLRTPPRRAPAPALHACMRHRCQRSLAYFRSMVNGERMVPPIADSPKKAAARIPARASPSGNSSAEHGVHRLHQHRRFDRFGDPVGSERDTLRQLVTPVWPEKMITGRSRKRGWPRTLLSILRPLMSGRRMSSTSRSGSGVLLHRSDEFAPVARSPRLVPGAPQQQTDHRPQGQVVLDDQDRGAAPIDHAFRPGASDIDMIPASGNFSRAESQDPWAPPSGSGGAGGGVFRSSSLRICR